MKIREEWLNRSLEELASIERKLEKKFEWLVVGTSCGLPILGVLSHNNLEIVGVSTIISSVLVVLKCQERINFMYNSSNYYCHSKEFQEAYDTYQIFLDEFKKLAQDLEWDNEMKVFSGYSYLFKQGYLSLPHEFYFSRSSDNVLQFLGSNVILGYGSCRHINSMLRDLLCNLGYSAYCFGINLDKDITYLNSLEVKKVDESLELVESTQNSSKLYLLLHSIFRLADKIMKNETNHLVTLVEKEKDSYFMDALNNTLFFIDKRGRVFQRESVFDIDNTKCSGKILNYGKNLEVKKILKETDLEEVELLLADYYEVWNQLPDYRDTFSKFYLEHRELYEEIVEKRRVLKKSYHA